MEAIVAFDAMTNFAPLLCHFLTPGVPELGFGEKTSLY